MTVSAATATPTPGAPLAPLDYQPGVCNIGPDEIRRRRRSGHVGVIGSVVWLGILIAIDAPAIARLTVAIPATIAASGYLQARLRFCAGFGARGVFNFGPLGSTDTVADADDRARDRARATRIGLAGMAIGVAAGVVAALLPIP
jgi:hypothetical protein